MEENRTHHNVIEFNHVHDLVHGVLSDAGLIYCLGVSPGSVIRNNVFHDIWPYDTPPFGWGIYLDAQCGNYLVENNLVYNTRSGGLMFNNGGHAHTIQNNIFALNANYALWPYNERRPSTFQRNIVYLTQGDLFIPYGERSLNERLAAKEPLGVWDENLYWHTSGADRLRFYRRMFADWQSLGLDRKSRIADPQFVDVQDHDFRLQPTSPALTIGFQPLDISRVGLYGDPAWTGQCRHADCPRKPLPPPPPRGRCAITAVIPACLSRTRGKGDNRLALAPLPFDYIFTKLNLTCVLLNIESTSDADSSKGRLWNEAATIRRLGSSS